MKKVLALLLSSVLAFTLLAGCGQQKKPAESTQTEPTQTESTELQKVVFTEPVRGYHWAPAYLAQTLGYFKEEGLDAEFQTIKGSDPGTAIFTGAAQFTLLGIEMALMANEAGQNCKIVASTTQKYPYQLIGANETYQTIESLKGGVIAGGMGANSAPQAFSRACIASAGLVPDTDISVLTMASVGYAGAIASGEIQAAVSTNPWSAKMLQDAGGVVIVDGTDDAVIKEMIGSASYELMAVITSDELIKSNPELVQKTVNAIAKAMQWMEKATPEQIVEKLLPLFPDAQEELLYDATYDADRKVANFTGYHTEDGFRAGVALTKNGGGIKTDLTADQIYDESFLDNAWKTLKK